MMYFLRCDWVIFLWSALQTKLNIVRAELQEPPVDLYSLDLWQVLEPLVLRGKSQEV